MEWKISFITQEQFKNHIRETIRQYGDKLKPYDVRKFNSNLIDPVKMVFDKAIYGQSWEELISSEIFRQRDKSTTNDIGYFHQRFFKYIQGCNVPNNGESGGWDVIVDKPEGYQITSGNVVHRIYVEMKNKHNTMNSSASSKTYMKMQNQLIQDDDCACFLVEAIAKRSQNIAWSTTVDHTRFSHARIRRVSLDLFYEIATGEKDAFFQICQALPVAVREVVSECEDLEIPHDTVFEELQRESRKYRLENDDLSFLMAMYMLGFKTYIGFDRLEAVEPA